MVYFFLLALLICIGIWILSIMILSKSNKFPLFILINSIIVGAYFHVIFDTNYLNKNADAYGLQDIFLFIIFAMIHSIAGFIFAKYINKNFITK